MPSTEQKNIHITVAERNKNIAERLQLFLSRRFDYIEIAPDNVTLTAALLRETPPDLLIVDLEFYVPDVQPMLDQLQELHRGEEQHTRILAMTQNKLTDKQQALCERLGITILPLPFELDQFGQVITELLT